MRHESCDYDGEDPQPPMCGGGVFNKFRPRPKQNSERSYSQRGRSQSFGQQPVKDDFRSATSSDNSFDEGRMSPETALLLPPKATKPGKGSKIARRKDFMPPISKASEETEDAIHARKFSMNNFAGAEANEEAPTAVEFDPNDINKLRSLRIRSMKNKTKVVKMKTHDHAGSFQSSLPSVTEVPSEAGRVMESLGVSQTSNLSDESISDSDKLRALRSMKDVVTQQQENLHVMATQNQYYRKKLGSAQMSFHKLYKNQMNQASLIEKLQMEKDSYEAEAVLLREEMQAIRQRLNSFKQTVAKSSTQESKQDDMCPCKNEENAKITSVVSATEKVTTEVDAGASNPMPILPSPADKRRPARQQASRSTTKSNNVDYFKQPSQDSEEPKDTSENVTSYWKREWDLSIREFDNSTKASVADRKEIEDHSGEKMYKAHDPFADYSKSTEGTLENLCTTEIDQANEAKVLVDPGEYKKDMDFVRHLLVKYQSYGVSKEKESRVKSSVKTGQPQGYDSDGYLIEEEQEAVIEIENMTDVDRAYNKRQAEKEILRALEHKDLDCVEVPAPYVEPVDEEGEAVEQSEIEAETEKKPKSTSHDRSQTHLRQLTELNDTRGKVPLSEQKTKPAIRLSKVQSTQQSETGENCEPQFLISQEKPTHEAHKETEPNWQAFLREAEQQSEHSSYEESRQDKSYRSEERSDYGPVRDVSSRTDRSDYQPREDVPSYGNERPVYDGKKHRLQSSHVDYSGCRNEGSYHRPEDSFHAEDYDSRHDYSCRSEIADSTLIEHSERSEHIVSSNTQARTGIAYTVDVSSPFLPEETQVFSPLSEFKARNSGRSERSTFSEHSRSYSHHNRRRQLV